MTTEPRVLVVTNLWPEDGGYRGIFVQEQVDAVRALGFEIDVEVVAQSRGRADYLLAAPRVGRRARAGRYDVVHIHYGLSALSARLAGRAPRVLTLHGSDVLVPWQARCTRLGAGRIAQRIYVSQRLAEAAHDPDALVIPGAVDLSLFAPIGRAPARQRLGLDADRPVALFGADPRQAPKRYDIFQAVLDRLRGQGLPVAELVLAEPGQKRSDVPVKFAAADVLLFTSQRGHEGSPTVVKEATVMGLPVVSTDVGDVAGILREVEPSAVVAFPADWGSDRATREVVAGLAGHAGEILRRPHRSNGRERNGWLGADRIAARVADVYRRAAGAR